MMKRIDFPTTLVGFAHRLSVAFLKILKKEVDFLISFDV
jgi:molybdate-binding protein